MTHATACCGLQTIIYLSKYHVSPNGSESWNFHRRTGPVKLSVPRKLIEDDYLVICGELEHIIGGFGWFLLLCSHIEETL
jgi:hypothetical protein